MGGSGERVKEGVDFGVLHFFFGAFIFFFEITNSNSNLKYKVQINKSSK